MTGFVQNLLTDAVGAFFGSDYLRDFNHAAKTFRTNSYQYAPKNKFLFHVYFDINPAAYNIGIAEGANYGLAVKTIKLPSYSMDMHQLNQYNRKRLVQTKIKYDPVDITFHDDAGTASGPLAGGIIRKLWENYYRYYYNDSTKPAVQLGTTFLNSEEGNSNGPINNYNKRTQYTKLITGDADWGYKGETGAASGVKVPFFKTINIFGFNQHKFVAYILVNPMITRFGHDTYSYADGAGTMENTMTIDYETVVYESGAIAGSSPDDIVKGFGTGDNYDRTVSPIAVPGSQNTITGQGGLVDAGNGFIDSLAAGNITGAIKIAGTAINTAKNMNLSQTALSELTTGIQNAAGGTPNRSGIFAFPIYAATPAPKG